MSATGSPLPPTEQPTPVLALLRRLVQEWTQQQYVAGTLAVTPEGASTDPCDAEAVRWCLTGKVDQLTGFPWEDDREVSRACHDALARASGAVYGNSPSVVNDYFGYAAAMQVVRQAMAAEAKQGAPDAAHV